MSISEKADEIKSIWSSKEALKLDELTSLASKIINCWNLGGKLAFCGNGGSAAEASHLAAEFVGKCVIAHDPWPALCLNESTASLTGISNDFGFDQVLLRQSKALLREGDLIIGLSTSGVSENVLRVLEDSHNRGIHSILWTSEKLRRPKPKWLDEVWIAPTSSTPRAQEIHLTWGHLLSEIIEETLCK
jgi:D-sedoheptulose 7-phosphate isomerase